MAVIALIGFFWGVKDNQFDDVDSASIRMLFEDDSTTKGDRSASQSPDDCNQ
jgi:cbb3-type cytochrome oxidase maturation protein